MKSGPNVPGRHRRRRLWSRAELRTKRRLTKGAASLCCTRLLEEGREVPDPSSLIRVIPSDVDTDGKRGIFGKFSPPVDLDVSVLRENIKKFLDSVNGMLTDVPELAAPYKLDEIEIKVEVDAEGSIQLIGGVKVGATGGITFRMTRK